MAIEILRPDGDDTIVFARWPASPATNYDKVDETASHDSDSTYVKNQLAETEDIYTLTAYSGSGTTINSVTVKGFGKYITTSGDIKFGLKLGANTVYGIWHGQELFYAQSTSELSRPGGGGWTEGDLADLKVILRMKLGKLSQCICTQIEVVIDYTDSGNHPVPTDVEIDKASSPVSNVGEHFSISAVWQATGGHGSATHASVEVASDLGFTSFMWQSGWIDIEDIHDNIRCELIPYAGTYLSDNPPNDKYYVRIKFKDDSAVESQWSATAEVNPVFVRMWHDNDSPFRHELTWITPHLAMSAGDIQKFTFKTGNRIIVTKNGDFNESVQASGGFQVDYHDGKTHIVYLSEIGESTDLEIYIVTKDHQSDTWGTPVRIANSATWFDTHYFPVMCKDKLGYLYVFYGCHYSTIKWAKSRNPNDSSLWTVKGNLSSAEYATYPVAFLVDDGTSTGQIFVMYRAGTSSARYTYRFVYTLNGGTSWSSYKDFIQDASASKYVTYCYGIRLRRSDNRLFISYTFVHGTSGDQDSMNISCAYCDWENSGDYFNDWYYMDDTSAGTTDSSPIDYNSSKAIMLSHQPVRSQIQDHRCAIFTETLELDSNGSPVVFFELKWYEGSATEETYLACAIWTGSAWSIVYISDQLNMMLRVRRSSIAVQTDRNGHMQMLMPVAAKTFHHMEAAADDDSVDVTRSEGSNNYELVDDGITICDADQTYLDLAATTGKASFTAASGQNIRTDATILGVEVEFTAKHTGSGADVRPYLDDGTEYDGYADSLASDYRLFKTMWALNPADSEAWEPADINDQAISFGVKNNVATEFRVTKVIMRVYYTLASDPKHASTELWLITSLDNGATWTAVKEVSRNSVIGVPIMNHMHHLENEQIGFIWSSGKHIFMYGEEPFGLMQDSGIDLKLFYGDSEIDRVLDYSNLNKSKLEFKLPEVLAADKARAPKALMMYHGDKDTVINPLANPDNVYKGFYNAEDYDDGDSIDGTDGWTATTGTWTCHRSPPQHANKVAGGEGSYKVVSISTGILVRTLGTDLTNLWISCYLWNESGSGKQSIRIFDGSNYFEVGIDASNKRFYYDNNTSVTTTDIPARGRNYHKVTIHVTSSGCSMYIGEKDLLVVREAESSIVQADTLDLRVNASITAFFDLLIISTSVASTTSHAEHADADWWVVTGHADGHGPNTEDSEINDWALWYNVDAKVDCDSLFSAGDADNVVGIDIIMQIILDGNGLTGTHTWLCELYLLNIGTYPNYGQYPDPDPPDIADRELSLKFKFVTTGETNSDEVYLWDDTLEPPDYSATPTSLIQLRNLTQGPKSFKVDCYSVLPDVGSAATDFYIHAVTVYNVETPDPVLQIGTFEPARGWRMDAVLKGASQDSWIMDGKLDGDFLLQSMTLPIALMEGIQARRILPIDLKHITTAQRRLQFDVLGWMADCTHQLPMEINEGLTANRIINIDITSIVQLSRMLPFEIMVAIAGKYALPFEIMEQSSAARIAVFEVLEQLKDGSRNLPFDIASLVTMQRMLPFEVNEGLSAGRIIPIDLSVLTGGMNRSIPFEVNEGLASGRRLWFDFKGTASYSRQLPFEIDVRMESERQLPFETNESMTASRTNPFELLQQMSSARVLPFEIYGSVFVTAMRKLIIEIGEKVSSDRQLPFETVAKMDAASRRLPIEISEGMTAGRRFPFDLKHIGVYSRQIPFETNMQMASSRIIPFEINESMTSGRQLPFAILQGLISGRRIPFEITGAVVLAAMRSLVFEIGEKMTSGRITPFEVSVIMSAARQTPFDLRAEMSAARRLPFDFMGTMSYLRSLVFDIKTKTAAGIVLPFEIEESVVSSRRLPFVTLMGMISGRQLPFEYVNAVTSMRQIPFEWSEKFINVARILPLEIGQLCLAARIAAFEVMEYAQINRKIPFEIQGALEVVFNRMLPFEIKTKISHTSALPFETLVQVASRRQVPFEISVTATAARSLNFEINELLRATANVVFELLGSVNASRKLNFDVIGTIQRTLVCNFEISEGMTCTSKFPLEILERLVAERELPIEIIGILVASAIITDAYLLIPNTIDVQMLIPDILNPIIRVGKTSNVQLSIPEAIDAYLKTAGRIDDDLLHS